MPYLATVRQTAQTAGRAVQEDTARGQQGRALAPPANHMAQASKSGLPARLQAGLETLSGLSMDDVQVHHNSPQPAQLQAAAYTKGKDIHIGPGQERHLPHEAWHVVQQKQGRVKPNRQALGMAINDQPALEQEAN